MTVVLLLDKRLIWNNSSNNSNYLYRVTTSIIVGPLKTFGVSLVWRRGDFFNGKKVKFFFFWGGGGGSLLYIRVEENLGGSLPSLVMLSNPR